MYRHFILYKPDGYLCQFKGEPKKKFLGELYGFPEGTMAIGRLDEDSEGLLILSTSGVTSERIRSKSVEKEYHVMVDGIITEDAIQKITEGIEIGFAGKRYITLPCKVTRLDPPPFYPPRNKRIRDERHGPVSWISVTVNEGKFRQIRKMTAAAGYPTLRLIRVRIGDFNLDGMNPGDVVEIGDPAPR